MTLHTLQLFLRSLIEPLSLTGSSIQSADDLRRACEYMATLGEMNVGQFADLVHQAREYQVTKQHAIPAFLQPFIAGYDRLASLKARAAAPDVNREELSRDLDAAGLDSFALEDLVQLAKAFGWTVDLKARKVEGKKVEAIDAIWVNLTGQPRPKPTKAKESKPRTKKSKPVVLIDEIVQKVNGLKERATSPEVSREELERLIVELKLNSLSKDEAIALASLVSRDEKAKTKKAAIDAVERMVLEAKEMHLAGTH